jgi:hypothetical protein
MSGQRGGREGGHALEVLSSAQILVKQLDAIITLQLTGLILDLQERGMRVRESSWRTFSMMHPVRKMTPLGLTSRWWA